jgi:hypothetical protein
MLLDITVSPCSRVTMFFYMLMQITARLLGKAQTKPNLNQSINQ